MLVFLLDDFVIFLSNSWAIPSKNASSPNKITSPKSDTYFSTIPKGYSMFEYKVIRIKINVWTSKPERDYREVIEEYAEAGWRFVQVVPKNWYSGTEGYYMDVIFEKPKDNYV